MTVSSLWNVLNESNCGRPVGIDSFPLRDRGRRGTFAVDTSIWICEAISSTALSSFHADPALYLIYQRTIKLLKCGFGLIFVLEGASRRITGGQELALRKRRSGSQFVAATKRCETLLRMLGVPLVYAEAEGEALCALLNEKGLVDAVISNDADCFLFGAKCLLTKFTLENLENNGTVMRYDSDRLRAAVGVSSRSITLSRKDLVAFALLTGSDMTSGVTNVGHRKAITFMDACRSLTQQPDEDTCLNKLLEWGKEASEQAEIHLDVDDNCPSTIQTRCCSLCLHPGSKDVHARDGCAECGTSAGEGCFVVTSIEKIVRSMQQKIAKSTMTNAQHVVDVYFSPNANLIPSALASVASAPCVASPAAAELFQTTLFLKGHSQSSSQEYVRSTLPQLLARLDLNSTSPRNVYATISNQKYKPIPIRVEKMLVKKSVPCYEVIWAIVIDKPTEQQIEFSTHEFQSLINKAFPRLVEAFHREQRKKQRGLIEEERHRKFVGTNKPRNTSQQQREKQFNRSMKPPGQGRKRERNFDAQQFRRPRVLPERNPHMQSHDVTMLMDHMHRARGEAEVRVDKCKHDGVEDDDSTHFYGQNQDSPIQLDVNQGHNQDKYSAAGTQSAGDSVDQDDSECSSDDHPEERNTYDISRLWGTAFSSSSDEEDCRDNANVNNQSHQVMPSLSPNQERIFCNLGTFVVECTPIRKSKF